MKISSNPKHDVLYLEFSEDEVADTVKVDGGVLIDYGDRGQMIRIEIIDASRFRKRQKPENLHLVGSPT